MNNNDTIRLFTKRMRQLRLEKAKRENRELAQTTVSDELDIHVNTLRSYESPNLDQMPKIERLKKIKN